jgi:hypothetical protein
MSGGYWFYTSLFTWLPFLPQCLHAPYPLFTSLFYFLNVYYHGWMGDQWEPSDSAVFSHFDERASDAFGVCA